MPNGLLEKKNNIGIHWHYLSWDPIMLFTKCLYLLFMGLYFLDLILDRIAPFVLCGRGGSIWFFLDIGRWVETARITCSPEHLSKWDFPDVFFISDVTTGGVQDDVSYISLSFWMGYNGQRTPLLTWDGNIIACVMF